MQEHCEEPCDASPQKDITVAVGSQVQGGLPARLRPTDVLALQRTAGNGAVARLVGATGSGRRRRGRLLQRRAAHPVRSDTTRTITFPLKVYTIDAESFAQAQTVADTLNAFSGAVFDQLTQSDYKIVFSVAVYAPPEPDILERAFGDKLHYSVGAKRLRKRRYRDAAQRWWVQILRQEGNTGVLYLGDNPPTEVTKAYLLELAAAYENKRMGEIRKQLGTRKDAARQQYSGSALASALDAAENWARGQSTALAYEMKERRTRLTRRLNDPEAFAGSRGTTFDATVIQMRGPGGTEAYKHNVRLHELMHALGLDFEMFDRRESVMSYPYVSEHRWKDTLLSPDVDALYMRYYDAPGYEALIQSLPPPPSRNASHVGDPAPSDPDGPSR